MGLSISIRLSAAMCVVAVASASAAAQFAPGQPGMPPTPFIQPGGPMPFGPAPMMQQAMPSLARKMTEIMALHEIVGMGLTAADISSILPPLRELRDAQKALESRMTQILDEHKRALLSAQPDANPPHDPAPDMRAASQRYAEAVGKTGEALSRAIGPERAQHLLTLILGGPQQTGPMMPAPVPSFQPGQPNPYWLSAPTPPGTPPPGQFAPQPGGTLPPNVPVPPARASQRARRAARQSVVPGAGQNSGFAPVLPGRPGMPPMQPGQPGMMPGPNPFPQLAPTGPPFGMPGAQMRLTISELVDLLEQKLAAMKK